MLKFNVVIAALNEIERDDLEFRQQQSCIEKILTGVAQRFIFLEYSIF